MGYGDLAHKKCEKLSTLFLKGSFCASFATFCASSATFCAIAAASSASAIAYLVREDKFITLDILKKSCIYLVY